jgi:hypothetical protein
MRDTQRSTHPSRLKDMRSKTKQCLRKQKGRKRMRGSDASEEQRCHELIPIGILMDNNSATILQQFYCIHV